jgi:predicted enzyme related to lactoylglutathione lyase
MLNFRVHDLDAMVEQLRAAGEAVDVDPERYSMGRFAGLRDPEGNGVQLWQPMDPE